MSSRKQPSSRGWVGALTVTVISLAVTVLLVASRQFVTDNFNFYGYHPDSTIESFVSRSGMSERGKFFFYASKPVVEDADDFNKDCERSEAQTAILGCYDGQGIYIYNVTDSRLAGIRTTTAAHEMLHAAYERLSAKNKQKVDQLLEAEYNKLKNDKDLSARMAFYDRTEPGEQDNELHSVIGTEISSISPELEAYYGQYFTDRSKVVMLHSQYESVFTSLQNQADALSRQISELSTGIKNDSTAYNEEADSLKDDIRTFNDRAKSGNFSTRTEFDTERRRLLARVNALEGLRTKINDAIQEYNQLVTQLNGIATQTEDLNRSIDSSLATPPSL